MAADVREELVALANRFGDQAVGDAAVTIWPELRGGEAWKNELAAFLAEGRRALAELMGDYRGTRDERRADRAAALALRLDEGDANALRAFLDATEDTESEQLRVLRGIVWRGIRRAGEDG